MSIFLNVIWKQNILKHYKIVDEKKLKIIILNVIFCVEKFIWKFLNVTGGFLDFY